MSFTNITIYMNILKYPVHNMISYFWYISVQSCFSAVYVLSFSICGFMPVFGPIIVF